MFPCKLRILPEMIFNKRAPIVVGVRVEAGIVRVGTPICVPSRECVHLGRIFSIESNHKPVEEARTGMEVCIRIDPTDGETPKLYGRHFDLNDLLVSKVCILFFLLLLKNSFSISFNVSYLIINFYLSPIFLIIIDKSRKYRCNEGILPF